MSSKKKTQTTATFDPTGMSSYQGLQDPIKMGLQSNMQDPWTAMAGNAQLQAGNRQQFNQDYTSGVASNMGSRGINPNSPLFARSVMNAGNATRMGQNEDLNNLLLQAGQVSQGSAVAASQYQPLQTGGTQTTKLSGVGSYV